MDRRWWGGIAGLVVLFGLLSWPFLTQPNDTVLIRQTMEQAIEASREGRPTGVLEHLSGGFTFNGQSPESRAQIAKVIQMLEPDATFDTLEASITGGTAKIVSSVRLRLKESPESTTYPRVEIVLVKSSAPGWLFLPSPRWKIRSVDAAGANPFAEGL